jgi:hypothetical protein
MNTITKSTLKTYLNQRSREELIADIVDLFTKFRAVQSYYQAKLYPVDKTREQLIADIADLFTKFRTVQSYYQAKLYPVDKKQLIQKYKTVIQREFFSEQGFGRARRSVARQAISEYKKVSGDPVGLADLMVFFVEMGVRFTNEYGDMDEPFYSSMESMYYKALQHIVKYALQDTFELRCRKIVDDAYHTGWGFHDTLSEMFYEYYEG